MHTGDAMSVTTLMTAEELLALPDDGWQYELVWGELRRKPLSGGDASHLGLRFGGRINFFAEEHDLGYATGADGGFRLARDPDVVLIPDAAYVRWDRMPPKGERSGFLPVAPDLAVEVVSPGDTRPEVAAKVALYLQLGVGVVWIVDEPSRTFAVHFRNRDPVVLRVGDVLEGGDVLPGFRWPLSDIFR